MNVYRYMDDSPKFTNAVLTIGTFDGVHLGHQRIIGRIRELAAKEEGESVLLTFHPHPRQVLHPEDDSLRLIQTLDERIASLEHYGIDNLIIGTFSNEFALTQPEDYVREFLVSKINPKAIVIGYNHRFGIDRTGDVELMKRLGAELGFSVHLITKEELDHISISSTRIRTALTEGDIDLANKLMGHAFELSGTVIRGNGMGAQLGFPTANIFVEDKTKLIPGTGVFAVLVDYKDKTYKGMLYIGFRPTFSGSEKSIEVNVFDLDETLYGETLKLRLMTRLRGDMKFDSGEHLSRQLGKDKQHALAVLSG